MAKILLVEDDNNLREIYAARLQAEGHEIVSASNGEEALATAVKEKPDLVIADVMMPKISGFDMLDILRSTPETKDTKVIMMTALSQKEDRERGEKLGADRYLVKSQVTLEDVVGVVQEVLNDKSPAAQPKPDAAPAPAATPPAAEPSAAPAADTPASSAAPAQAQDNQPATAPPTQNDQPATTPPAQAQQPPPQGGSPPPKVVADAPGKGALSASTTAEPAGRRKKVIQPISSSLEGPDMNALLEKELMHQARGGTMVTPQTQPAAPPPATEPPAAPASKTTPPQPTTITPNEPSSVLSEPPPIEQTIAKEKELMDKQIKEVLSEQNDEPGLDTLPPPASATQSAQTAPSEKAPTEQTPTQTESGKTPTKAEFDPNDIAL